MDWPAILTEAFTGAFKNIAQIACIVIPLLLVVELTQAVKLLDKATRFFTPLTRALRVTRAGNLPLFAGLFFGVIYGGSIIIKCAREGALTKREVYIVDLFLVLCHAMLEEPLLFVAVGAVAWPLYTLRVSFALVITCVFAHCFAERVFLPAKSREEIKTLEGGAP
jgi:hypothetical protein